MSGIPISPGDLVVATSYGPNFTSDLDLAARGSPVVSGYVAPLLAKPVMQRTQAALFCEKGAYKLTKDSARIWLFEDPPEGPYVVAVSDATLQHLIWRTPVNYSKDLMVVRLGERLLRIRRPVLLRAAEWLHALPEYPFRILDRKLTHFEHGIPADSADLTPDQIAEIARLTPGELWALSSMVKRKPEVGAEPDLIDLTSAAGASDDE